MTSHSCLMLSVGLLKPEIRLTGPASSNLFTLQSGHNDGQHVCFCYLFFSWKNFMVFYHIITLWMETSFSPAVRLQLRQISFHKTLNCYSFSFVIFLSWKEIVVDNNFFESSCVMVSSLHQSVSLCRFQILTHFRSVCKCIMMFLYFSWTDFLCIAAFQRSETKATFLSLGEENTHIIYS